MASDCTLNEIWSPYPRASQGPIRMVTTFWLCQACLRPLHLLSPLSGRFFPNIIRWRIFSSRPLCPCGILRHRSCDRGCPDLGIWLSLVIADGFIWSRLGGPQLLVIWGRTYVIIEIKYIIYAMRLNHPIATPPAFHHPWKNGLPWNRSLVLRVRKLLL